MGASECRACGLEETWGQPPDLRVGPSPAAPPAKRPTPRVGSGQLAGRVVGGSGYPRDRDERPNTTIRVQRRRASDVLLVRVHEQGPQGRRGCSPSRSH